MDKWEGKVAVVTGASSGIGRAIAIKLAENGMVVAALARRVDRLKELSAQFKGKGSIKGYQCDVSKESDIDQTFSQIQKDLGTIRVLVNNAGVALQSSIMDFEMAKWHQMFDVNVFGMFSCIKHVVKAAQTSKATNLIHIVNINSVAGHSPPLGADRAVYSATKHCVTLFTKSLLKELAIQNLKHVRVTSLSPGVVETEIFDAGGWNKMDIKKMSSLSPEDIANGLIATISAADNVVISEITIKPAGEVF